MKGIRAHVITPLLLCFFALTISAAGQDLGSSNKLFGQPKKPETTEKKPVHKAAVGRRNLTHKTIAATKRRTRKATVAVKKIQKSHVAAARTPTPVRTETMTGKTPVRIAPRSPESSLARTAVDRNPPLSKIIVMSDADFDRLIEEGIGARDRHEYLAAETAYRRASVARPADVRAFVGLGALYAETLRWEQSEEAYRSAIRIDPRNTTAYVGLSYVLDQPLDAPNLSDRYDEAEKLARKAVELNKDNAAAYDQLGFALERRGLIGVETEDAYRRAAELDPTFAAARAHLGRLLRLRGKPDEAVSWYTEALLRAKDAASLVAIAASMQSEQDFSDSAVILDKALSMEPKNPKALVLFGRALIAVGDLAEAERTLRRATEVGPNGFAGYSLLGTLYLRQKKNDAAENALLQALPFAGAFGKRELAGQFESVGDAYFRDDNSRAAERCYKRAFALNSDRATLTAKIAKAHG